MAILELRVELRPVPGGRPPEVRAFVDLRPDGGLATEQEVTLSRRNGCWRGDFFVQDDGREPWIYRLGIAGEVGTQWSYRISRRGSSEALIADADCLERGKSWLVGCVRLKKRATSHGRADSGEPRRRGGRGAGRAQEPDDPRRVPPVHPADVSV